MNQAGQGAAPDAHLQAQAVLRRQQQVLQSITDELVQGQNRLREMRKLRDHLYSRLFPPVRADRDLQDILTRIEEIGTESTRLKQAILDQEAELRILDTEMSSTDDPSLAGLLVNSVFQSQNEGGDLSQRLISGRENLANLKAKLFFNHTNLDKLHISLSPIGLLPVEVLGDIFAYCEDSRFSSITPVPHVLSITHVCDLWRSIAINKPSLWGNLWVALEDGYSRKGWSHLVKLWIDRSKEHPLKLTLRENDRLGFHPSGDSTFFRILDLYIPHLQRWKYAHLSNPRFEVPGLAWFAQIPSQASFPLLESLTVKCHTMEANDVRTMMKLLDRSPRLHSVCWKIKSQHFVLDFPWAQLTHLELLDFLSLEEALNILSVGTQLVSADLTIQISPLPMNEFHEHIVHRNLEKLLLGVSGDLGILFDHLTAPKLTELTVDELSSLLTLHGTNGPWKQDAFMAFLQRSRSKLQELFFLDIKPNPNEILAILQYLSPTLTRFTIENLHWICITDEVLTALTYSSATGSSFALEDDDSEEMPIESGAGNSAPVPVLCPHLEFIKLWGCIASTDGVLADMIQSRIFRPPRSSGPKRLKMGQVGVHPGQTQPQDTQRLTDLQKTYREIKYITLNPDEY